MMRKLCVMMVVFAALCFFSSCDQSAIEATMPADLAAQEEITQEYLDTEVEAGRYNRAELKEDGSVTYQMSFDQHKALLTDMEMLYRDSIDEMVLQEGSGIAAIEVSEDFTDFIIRMSVAKLPANEAFITEDLIYMGRMYAVYNWTDPDEICVTYIDLSTDDTIAEKTFEFE